MANTIMAKTIIMATNNNDNNYNKYDNYHNYNHHYYHQSLLEYE